MGCSAFSVTSRISYFLAFNLIILCTIYVNLVYYERNYFFIIQYPESTTFDVINEIFVIIYRIILNFYNMKKEALLDLLRVQNSLVIYMMKKK